MYCGIYQEQPEMCYVNCGIDQAQLENVLYKLIKLDQAQPGKFNVVRQ